MHVLTSCNRTEMPFYVSSYEAKNHREWAIEHDIPAEYCRDQ